jgi:hypothetical protein
MRFEPGVSQQLGTDSNNQPSPRFGDCHQTRGGFILLLTSYTILSLVYRYGPSLGWKGIYDYFILFIEYHWGNIIEGMSEKASFLKKLLKNI